MRVGPDQLGVRRPALGHARNNLPLCCLSTRSLVGLACRRSETRLDEPVAAGRGRGRLSVGCRCRRAAICRRRQLPTHRSAETGGRSRQEAQGAATCALSPASSAQMSNDRGWRRVAPGHVLPAGRHARRIAAGFPPAPSPPPPAAAAAVDALTPDTGDGRLFFRLGRERSYFFRVDKISVINRRTGRQRACYGRPLRSILTLLGSRRAASNGVNLKHASIVYPRHLGSSGRRGVRADGAPSIYVALSNKHAGKVNKFDGRFPKPSSQRFGRLFRCGLMESPVLLAVSELVLPAGRSVYLFVCRPADPTRQSGGNVMTYGWTVCARPRSCGNEARRVS